jgi:hypothetical protein
MKQSRQWSVGKWVAKLKSSGKKQGAAKLMLQRVSSAFFRQIFAHFYVWER